MQKNTVFVVNFSNWPIKKVEICSLTRDRNSAIFFLKIRKIWFKFKKMAHEKVILAPSVEGKGDGYPLLLACLKRQQEE